MNGRDVVRLGLLSAPRRPIVTKHAHRTFGVPLRVNCSCATRKQLRGPLLSVKNASPCADLELATHRGAPHIHGELLKLGITIGETSVAKYMVRERRPPSQTWRTFLNNHAKTLVSVDFFTVPTIRFQVLYVFLVLAHERRRVVHFNITAHPTAEWTAQQLREAFPFEQIPRYLLRDRDKIFGDEFGRQVRDMNIEEVLSAPRSPWQRAYIERLIGSIRRECLDHVIVCNETSLRRILTAYFSYYHATRPHLSLEKDSPEPRKVHPPELGRVISIPQVGGLHHRYERRAA